MKATAVAPSNIAFVKYWGKKDEVLRLPENGSVSMCLSNMLTTTTVEFAEKYTEDDVEVKGEGTEGKARIIAHLERIRKLAGSGSKAKVVSKNNFPSGTGLSSSASGFAALTLAASKAIGVGLTEKELSILARQGSGSACRSIPTGFTEWLDGSSSEKSYAISLYGPDYWQICDVVAVVSKEKKDISTTEGQKLTGSSIFYQERLKNIKNKIEVIKKLIREKDFTAFGEMLEAEALELHAIMLTSKPSLIYLMPNSLLLMKSVKKWRNEGFECYFTVNTGQDVHIIIEKKNVSELVKRLKKIEQIQRIIVNEPGEGARITKEHLF